MARWFQTNGKRRITPESAIAFGLYAEMGTTANEGSILSQRETVIPLANPIRSWTTYAFCLAAKTAPVPFGIVMSYQGELCRKYPPFAGKRQIAALHLAQRNVLAFFDLAYMLA